MNKNQGNQPIQAAGAYLYQLDDQRKGNLWGGHLQTQNQNETVHLQRAIKLILAAEDLQKALRALYDKRTEESMVQARAALSKAEL
jgi:hypothetical protein